MTRGQGGIWGGGGGGRGGGGGGGGAPFGAVEQPGPHLPLGTDAIFGDEIGLAVAERLDAFLAPTVRVGFSPHHMAFAGTLTVDEETFGVVARSIVRALAGHGFRRIVLLPTHGGNFRPLGAAVSGLPPMDGVKVITFPDVGMLLNAILPPASEMGLTPAEAGRKYIQNIVDIVVRTVEES